MKKILIAALALASVMPSVAQDTYENARLLGGDLNGTARYVGMGGALEALGADISTISTNPAGIGLFRHSSVSLSLGVINQQDAVKFDNLGKTNVSFDQVGFVYTMPSGRQSFLNFAFNYHKSRNFNQLLSAANRLNAASLSKQAYGKSELESDANGGYSLDLNDCNEVMGYRDATSNERAWQYTQWDYLTFNTFNYNANENEKVYAEADSYNFDRAHRGWIADYDFNISGNLNDRVYLGLTIGIHDVNYNGYSEYSEGIVTANGGDGGVMTLADERHIDGTGFDIKAGAIFRPFEESPFRLGVSVATPTWYDLTSSNATTLYNNTDPDVYNWGYREGSNSESYDFKYYTPWKFGLSAGHTIGRDLALGLSYEYASYGSADTRVNDGYDAYGYEESYSDKTMNANTENSLKGVHTLKVGAEYKPTPETAIRLGYNYVSPMYQETGVRDTYLNSIGNMYSSTTDYTNWKGTNRLTCGFGYRYEKLNLDLAYQYSTVSGEFHPFQAEGAAATDVSNKRHQVLFTIGYTF